MKRFVFLAALLASCATSQNTLTDATEQDREALQRHLQQRAPQLAAVQIIDIDRAGGFEARRPELGTVRILRDVYPARIVLRFEGKTETLSDLPVAGAARYGEDPLRYEKTLLDDWLERELRASRSAGR